MFVYLFGFLQAFLCPFRKFLRLNHTENIGTVIGSLSSVIKGNTVACAASGVGLGTKTARTEHQLVGCVTELRAKGISFDSNDLVLDGIFPR